MLGVARITNAGWRRLATGLALGAALALAGCGKKQETAAVVGQVIAHVGPDDVTQQEVDNELRLANVAPDKRTDDVTKAALSRIIERKYLVQQALAAKLDREPTVHLDLLRAREQILAAAYVQRDLSTKVSAISKNEVDAYIQSHADQFAKRQLFQIEQISFPPQRDMEALAAATKDFKSLDQVEAKLNDLGIKFSRGTGTLDGATMPPEMLKTLQTKKGDDIFFLRARTSATFFKVTSVDDKPLTGEDASQFAKRELRNDLAKKSAQDTYNNALATAKYEGDYARIMKNPPPAGAASESPQGEVQGEKGPGDAQGAEKPEAPGAEKPETPKDSTKK